MWVFSKHGYDVNCSFITVQKPKAAITVICGAERVQSSCSGPSFPYGFPPIQWWNKTIGWLINWSQPVSGIWFAKFENSANRKQGQVSHPFSLSDANSALNVLSLHALCVCRAQWIQSPPISYACILISSAMLLRHMCMHIAFFSASSVAHFHMQAQAPCIDCVMICNMQ